MRNVCVCPEVVLEVSLSPTAAVGYHSSDFVGVYVVLGMVAAVGSIACCLMVTLLWGQCCTRKQEDELVELDA